MQGNARDKNHSFRDLAVLVAEDDPRYRSLLLDNLRSLGVAKVRVERDCSAILAAIGAGDVDVLVTGWRVGCLTAVELVRKIRNGGNGHADLPIIMVTADTAKLQVEKARHAGVIGFLPLPLTPRAMAACLTNALDAPLPANDGGAPADAQRAVEQTG